MGPEKSRIRFLKMKKCSFQTISLSDHIRDLRPNIGPFEEGHYGGHQPKSNSYQGVILLLAFTRFFISAKI